MVQLDYIEQTGHGVPLIVSKYGRNVFDITENFITVTIPLANKEVAESTELDIDDKKYDLTATQQQILDIISADSTITIAELANQLQISTTAVSNAIKVLKKKQRIDRKGSKKGGHWLILE